MNDWEMYVRQFYAMPSDKQLAEWGKLTPQQREAFQGAYRALYSVNETSPRGGSATPALVIAGLTVFVIVVLSIVVGVVKDSRDDEYVYRPPSSGSASRSPTSGEFVSIGRALVRNGVTGCGEYRVVSQSGSSRAPEYTIKCSADGVTWRYWLVWPAIGKVTGPFATRSDVP